MEIDFSWYQRILIFVHPIPEVVKDLLFADGDRQYFHDGRHIFDLHIPWIFFPFVGMEDLLIFFHKLGVEFVLSHEDLLALIFFCVLGLHD